MTSTKTAPRKKTAIQHLQPSRLDSQLELMGNDIDLKSLQLFVATSSVNIKDAVLDIRATRTIEGASTLEVDVQDQDLLLWRSGKLGSRQDIQIDGLYFRLVAVKRSKRLLTLTFEEREITILRTYDTPIKQSLSTSRGKKTRAEFVLRMLREVKELPPIPYEIPELHNIQPIGSTTVLPSATERSAQRALGIPAANELKVKTNIMTEEQRKNAEIVLDVGASKLLPRSLLVMALMAAIQESSIINLRQPLPGDSNFLSPDPTKNPVGVFQQIKHWGWPASRNVAVDAAAFFDKLSGLVKGDLTDYAGTIERVQNSGQGKLYAQWRTQAERIVTAYGLVDDAAAANGQWRSDSTQTKDYEFYRGLPPASVYQKKHGKAGWGKENSWACITRLAAEVQWRAFFVSGKFYFISDDDLFSSKPIASINSDSEGILEIDGDYDEGKKNGTVTVTCFASRWEAPPGSVVQIDNEGPFSGRWLVNDIERSLFDRQTTITLKKPLPRLPEPSSSNVASATGQGTWTGADPAGTPPSKRQYKVGTGLVQPVPPGHHDRIAQGPHPTAGLTPAGSHDWYAIDFGADAGAPVVACENGVITKVSGHDPNEGPWDPSLGVHGPFGLSFYIKGDSGAQYYYTHLGSRTATEGLRVNAGEVLGTVGNYAKWGGTNHVHVGVLSPSGGHPDEVDLMNAPKAQP